MSSHGHNVEYLNNNKVLLAAVISLAAIVTLVLLLHAYARWFLHRRVAVVVDATGEPLQRRSLSYTSDTRPPDKGLDGKMITMLPLFTYDVEQGGARLECVVCLSLMEAGENGRFLPGCRHHFHVECIDTWLRCHSTCPVCRTIVKPEKPPASGTSVPVSSAVEDAAAQETVVASPTVTQTEVSVGIPTALPISSSSLGCSHKRMLRKSRSEGRVFPSVVNLRMSLSP